MKFADGCVAPSPGKNPRNWPGRGRIPLTLELWLIELQASQRVGFLIGPAGRGYTIQVVKLDPDEVPAVDSDGDGINDPDDLHSR